MKFLWILNDNPKMVDNSLSFIESWFSNGKISSNSSSITYNSPIIILDSRLSRITWPLLQNNHQIKVCEIHRYSWTNHQMKIHDIRVLWSFLLIVIRDSELGKRVQLFHHTPIIANKVVVLIILISNTLKFIKEISHNILE